MRYGIVLTTGDPRLAADLAAEAEDAGWDGVFTFDAIAIGAGPDVRPVDRARGDGDADASASGSGRSCSRPRGAGRGSSPARPSRWTCCRAAGSCSRWASGRSTTRASATSASRRRRGSGPQRLDETLAILDGLESGEPFAFEGEHYRFAPMTFLPTPGPAAADPGLGRGRVAARAVDAARGALGRDLRPGPGPGRQAGERARGAAADRRLAAPGTARRSCATGRSTSSSTA